MGAAEKIDAAKAKGGAAFIAYLPAGYPDVQASADAAIAVVESGADIIELGFPYSDPGMDGSLIQAATHEALSKGFKMKDLFGIVEQVAATGAAVEVMTYINPIFRYGFDAFARDFKNAGGAGLITPDLIPDEADPWIEAADRYDLDKIFLVAPSSRPERLKLVADSCRGFVYAASTMGVTGARSSVDNRARELVADTRAHGAERVCVGLGVSTGEQAAEIAEYADGVIVGSALIEALRDDPSLARLRALASDIAAGAHGEG
ncbi:tryptophan synthase subunit alpha [Flaviflexus salsibiostraticola]|uniref:Tryptophan synthase alpha chain n=1 Tax=Flaviflexus salsibiostraticola TaxID=1282737 RepID=A0A3Q8WSQ2_9ACTO|nr:tryptophan synthase subunit alpha [Flaviflexus salsibiostraticola]AZN29422.1 tryptophan synthase subunit alpha [Flaviflexus salsibiostraticola]